MSSSHVYHKNQGRRRRLTSILILMFLYGTGYYLFESLISPFCHQDIRHYNHRHSHPYHQHHHHHHNHNHHHHQHQHLCYYVTALDVDNEPVQNDRHIIHANDIGGSGSVASGKPAPPPALRPSSSGRSSVTRRPNGCPKTLNCTEGYFDEGKDCYDTTRIRCNCIAHCCLAFDCRDWAHLVQCRRKCGATPNRFGLKRSDRLECDKYVCERQFYDQAWDARNANDPQRQCIGHCCYAFDCRRALGYCRHACGVESWVTARPLG